MKSRDPKPSEECAKLCIDWMGGEKGVCVWGGGYEEMDEVLDKFGLR